MKRTAFAVTFALLVATASQTALAQHRILVDIDVPSGVAIVNDSFVPCVTLRNSGSGGDQFWLYFTIDDLLATIVYHESLFVGLPGGMQTAVIYPTTAISDTGEHLAVCWLPDSSWGMNRDSTFFRVVPPPDHDVMVEAILVPRDTVDSAALIIPTCVVCNVGLNTEDFPVYFTLPYGYQQMLTVTGLGPGERDTLEFVPYGVHIPDDSYDAVAWTLLAGDENPANDTCIEPFTVKVRDVQALAIVYPIGTLPDDTLIIPQARVKNAGSVAETFDVRFSIGTWFDDQTVTGLAPGIEQVVDFDTFRTSVGVWLARTQVFPSPPDPFPENDVVIDTFTVAGTVEHDVGVEPLDLPDSIVGVGDTLSFLYEVTNYGLGPESFWLFLQIYEPGSTLVYSESVPVTLLEAGSSQPVGFPLVVFWDEGEYLSLCFHSILGDLNPTNDTVRYSFWVLRRPGVKERTSVIGFSPWQLLPSHIRAGASIGPGLPPDVEVLVFDPTGREVAEDRPLAPGAYFVLMRRAGAGPQLQTSKLRKVVVTR